jgi:membrane-bound metal-dependent hydrolase YbcI (DUF457 family)
VDPFSHMLLAYLLNFGAFGPSGVQYVVAGAFAGALPDIDIVFFPISKYVPFLRHRGISHSLVGVTGIAIVGTFLVPRGLAWVFGAGFAAGVPWDYFVALEIGGLSHVLLDAMDHWSVPIFAPFSEVEYHFDADRIINVGAMSFTVISYGILIYERGRVPLVAWELTTWALLLMAITYLVVRLTGRWRIERVRRREGFTDVIPQSNPLVFLLVEEASTPEGRRVRYGKYQFLRGFVGPIRTLALPGSDPAPGPVTGADEAARRSHGASLAASWVLGETHHFAEVRSAPGCYEVFWHSLEMTFWGRAAGVIARVDSTTGAVETRTSWGSPERWTPARAP